MMHVSAVFSYVFILLQLNHLGKCGKVDSLMSAESALRTKLMDGYDNVNMPTWDPVTVELDMELDRIVSIDSRKQVVTSKVWLKQVWEDARFTWDPADYSGMKKITLPSESIWLPDIVLKNDADGDFYVSLMSDVIVYSNGTVTWKPPAIWNSACTIEVLLFPFDTQNCSLIFRSLTYDIDEVRLKPKRNKIVMDNFAEDGEWNVLDTPVYEGEGGDFVTFSLILKRQSLFYIINLILPCLLMTLVNIGSFYLPAASCEKITTSISTLLGLTFFQLLISSFLPPTSLAVSLMGKFIAFSVTITTFSVLACVAVINIHFRNDFTHEMSDWTRRLWLEILPPWLGMTRPSDIHIDDKWLDRRDSKFTVDVHNLSGRAAVRDCFTKDPSDDEVLHPLIVDAIENIKFIAECMQDEDEGKDVSDDWEYIAMVVDRLLLYIFSAICVLGIGGIFLEPMFVE